MHWRLVQDWDKEGLKDRSGSPGSHGGAGSPGSHGGAVSVALAISRLWSGVRAMSQLWSGARAISRLWSVAGADTGADSVVGADTGADSGAGAHSLFLRILIFWVDVKERAAVILGLVTGAACGLVTGAAGGLETRAAGGLDFGAAGGSGLRTREELRRTRGTLGWPGGRSRW